MKKALVALALTLAGSVSQATVIAVDLDKNGSFTAFVDAPNGLMWSNGTAFNQFGLTYKSASDAVSSLTLEGLSGWRLPTMNEFLSLYATQGVTYANASHTAGSMTTYLNDPNPLKRWGIMYWTSDALVTSNPALKDYYRVFVANSLPTDQTESRGASVEVGVWAVRTVTAVPEPQTYAMLLTGLGLIGATVLRRKNKQA
jgi:hypothetical protein